MELKSTWVAVFRDCLVSHITQWWVWAWIGIASLICWLAPLPFSVIGWVGIVGFIVYFAWGLRLVKDLREMPDDAWDPPSV